MNKYSENTESPVVRIGISPVRPDFSIGAYRTLIANTLLSSSEGGVSYIRIDDTNPAKHDDAHIETLLQNYVSLVGDSEALSSAPDEMAGTQDLQIGIRALRQSYRSDRYREVADTLITNGFACEEGDTIYFNLEAFIDRFGDVLEQPYVGSKVGRLVNLRAWRGKDSEDDSKFPIMAGKRALYHLATVVDDVDLGVTHVIRGSDKIDTQVPQDILRRSMDFASVTHAYAKLMTKAEGESIRLHDILQQGISTVAIRSYILSSLTGRPDIIYHSLEDAAEDFDLKKVRPGTDKYDNARMQSIQRKLRGK